MKLHVLKLWVRPGFSLMLMPSFCTLSSLWDQLFSLIPLPVWEQVMTTSLLHYKKNLGSTSFFLIFSLNNIITRGQIETQRQTPTQRECHVKIKAEIMVMHLQAKGCPRLLADSQKLGRRHGTDRSLPHSPQKETFLLTLIWFQTSSLRNDEAIHFCCLNHLVCGTSFKQP